MRPLCPQAQCQEVRKRKELELQILTEAIRSWEGEDIKTLGSVLYMSQVLIQCAGSEVPPPALPAFFYWGTPLQGPCACRLPRVPSLLWAVFLS